MCALFGGYYALKLNNEETERAEEDSAGDEIVDLASSDVTALSFQIDGETVTFDHDTEEDSWTLDDDETFPVDASSVSTLLSYFSPLSATRKLEDVEDASEYGLEDPQNEISLTDTEGDAVTLTIGDQNSGTGDDYVMVNDDETVIYTISSSVLENLPTDLYDYAVSEELPAFSSDNITAITVTRMDGDGEIISLNDEDEWVAESGTELDQDDIQTAVTNLGYLSYDGYIDHNCTDDDTYGFGETTFTIQYREYVTSAVDESETTDDADLHGETAVAESADTETETSPETETETDENVVLHTITFKVGDNDADGNYYVQQDGSTEVHIFNSAKLSKFLSL